MVDPKETLHLNGTEHRRGSLCHVFRREKETLSITEDSCKNKTPKTGKIREVKENLNVLDQRKLDPFPVKT